MLISRHRLSKQTGWQQPRVAVCMIPLMFNAFFGPMAISIMAGLAFVAVQFAIFYKVIPVVD